MSSSCHASNTDFPNSLLLLSIASCMSSRLHPVSIQSCFR